ncbi:MAG: serine/threonine-protein kinase, partial [Planctomycetota bacterium]
MAIEPRDERFLEFAVASGHLDGTRAHRLYEARKAAASSDPIEQFAVREGFLAAETVQAIITFARVGVTVVENVGPTHAEQSIPPEAPGMNTTVKDGASAGTGKGAARLGNRFGPYEILGELGRGGMGAVFRARKDAATDVVALKILADEKDPDEATTRRFDREIRAGRDIDSPNVVKVFDAGKVEGRLFFTMELIDGRSFDKVIDELTLRQKVEVFQKIARAVNQAHTRGYIHRDLKPQNIMITADLEPKVADFGLAKSLDRESRLTKTGAILGTIAYMSPEQAEGGGAHKLDGRTDIYALGAILYQLITGSVPFKAATSYGVIGLILTTDPDPPTSINPECPPALGA